MHSCLYIITKKREIILRGQTLRRERTKEGEKKSDILTHFSLHNTYIEERNQRKKKRWR
jgi:hypothetical protein